MEKHVNTSELGVTCLLLTSAQWLRALLYCILMGFSFRRVRCTETGVNPQKSSSSTSMIPLEMFISILKVMSNDSFLLWSLYILVVATIHLPTIPQSLASWATEFHAVSTGAVVVGIAWNHEIAKLTESTYQHRHLSSLSVTIYMVSVMSSKGGTPGVSLPTITTKHQHEIESSTFRRTSESWFCQESKLPHWASIPVEKKKSQKCWWSWRIIGMERNALKSWGLTLQKCVFLCFFLWSWMLFATCISSSVRFANWRFE